VLDAKDAAAGQHPLAATLSRREFITAGAALSGGLLLSLGLPAMEGPAPRAGGAAAAPRSPSAFIEISPDGRIAITTPSVEMGQGGHTAMPMILLEELGGSWSQLDVRDAAAAAIYNNPMFGQQSTVGSFSVRGWYVELRRIGAAGRLMLVQAAAAKWGVPAAECTVAEGRISHAASRKSCGFGEVAAAAALLPVPQDPPLKAQPEFRLIGQSPRRTDVADKVDGSARFGIDIVLPRMLYGAVQMCPTLSGTFKSFDDAEARTVKGYHSTVTLPDGVVVLASSYWQARKALAKLKVQYDLGAMAGLDSAEVSRRLHAGFDEEGRVARNDGDVATALAGAAQQLQAEYEVPFLAHACMEPMNCTVRGDESGCEVWCGTQSPQAAQAAAAKAFGLPADKVQVHVQYLGGGFGRRGEADFVAQAATAAKASGLPVKLVWSREEDIQHDFYRPAAAIRFRGGLDASGRLVALESRMISASSPSFDSGKGPPSFSGGVSDQNYAIPNFRVTGIDKHIGVRFGFWRSVNDSHNPFMFEGFIDELARAAKQDPLAFRRTLLANDRPMAKRQLATLELAAAKAGWAQPRAGHHLGIGCFEGFGSLIATVVDVTVKGREVTIHKVTTAVDCGVAVHPDNIRAQLEGGMVYGLAAVLRGEITLENGAVKQSNFTDYPMLLMAEMPVVESHIVPSSASPGGIGEPGTGPIAPALANAIYAATGERVRTLPLSRHGFTFKVARSRA
jgi:CO/xanthine dehydrogenase Mo-binding subunit